MSGSPLPSEREETASVSSCELPSLVAPIDKPRRSEGSDEPTRFEQSEKAVENVKPVDLETGAVGSTQSDPPDGGYGWVCVVCVFLMTTQTWGVNSSYAVFLNYYLTSGAFPTASPLHFAFIGGLSVGLGLLLSPLPTIAVRWWGVRTSVSIGIFFETLAFVAASFIDTNQIWQLFLTQGVCFGIGTSFIFVSTAGIIPQWFSSRRSLATAIGTAGSGFGGVVYALAIQALLDKTSLAWAFRFLAITTFTFNVISVILIRDRNAEIKPSYRAVDLGLFKKVEFWLLLGSGAFYMLGYIGVLFTVQSYATSLGLTSSQGSALSAILNGGQTIGRPLIGYFSDSIGRLNMSVGTYVLSSIFIFGFWIPSKTYAALIAFSLVSGLVLGTFWATVAPVTAEIMGMQGLPTALSMTLAIISIPAIFSEPIMLELRKTAPGYLSAQVFAGSMFAGGSICLLLLRGWKLRDLRRRVDESTVLTDGRDSKQSDDQPSIPVDPITRIKSQASGQADVELDLRKVPTHQQDGENVADGDNNTVIPVYARVPLQTASIWRLAVHPTWV